MANREKVHFRLIQTPCCSSLLCYVNPRLPSYCSECGKPMLARLRTTHAENILISDESAWLYIKDFELPKMEV